MLKKGISSWSVIKKRNGLEIFTTDESQYQVFESLLLRFGSLFKTKRGAIYVKTVLSCIKENITTKFTTPIAVEP